MSLKETMAADMDVLLFSDSDFAVTVLYNGIEITALAEVGDDSNSRNPNDREHGYGNAVFTVRAADVPAPGAGDTIEYQGEEYEYVSISQQSHGVYRLRFISRNSAVRFGPM